MRADGQTGPTDQPGDDERLPAGWQRAEPLGASRGHERQLAAKAARSGPGPFGGDPEDAARERHARDITGVLDGAWAARARVAAEPNRDARAVAGETAAAADGLDRLVVLADQLYVELHASLLGWRDYPGTAAADLVQNAATVLAEISLLLRNGYASGAEARWRGLHELACTAALFAADDDPAAVAELYLAHGERLLDDDPAYRQPWAADPKYYDTPFAWLARRRPPDRNGSPRRITQRDGFDGAALASAQFGEWIKPSHGPVHMSSRAVAAGAEQAGAAPAGYTREAVEQIAWQAGCSCYELVAHAVLLPDEPAFDPARRLAWTDAAAALAGALRPRRLTRPRAVRRCSRTGRPARRGTARCRRRPRRRS